MRKYRGSPRVNGETSAAAPSVVSGFLAGAQSVGPGLLAGAPSVGPQLLGGAPSVGPPFCFWKTHVRSQVVSDTLPTHFALHYNETPYFFQ